MISIKNIIWFIVTYLIIYIGIDFTKKLKFVQFDYKNMIKNLKKGKYSFEISKKQSLMLVLAGRIGIGSIAGMALAIYYGGAGTIFWMWIITLLSLPITFAECTLGSKYREKDGNKVFKGGPSYYIKNGLKNKPLSNLYSLLIIMSYIFGFLTIQSNTITRMVLQITSINPIIIGFIVSIITLFIISGGIKKIATFSCKLVPIMIILYISTSFYIVMRNINIMPTVIFNIIKEAFNIKSTSSGFIYMVIIGIQRGIFSTEAGMGTGAIASSTTNNKYAAEQGYVQMIGIYITSFLICTSTAFVILTSNYKLISFSDLNGIELALYAFKFHLGNIGNTILIISVILFSFSTILSGYYDGEASIKSLNKSNKSVKFLKIITVIVLFLGCLLKSTFVWNYVDIIVGFLAIINIYSVCKLKKEVFDEYNLYKRCLKSDKI